MGGLRVHLGDLGGLAVRVEQCPGMTLYSLLIDVLGGRPEGVPPATRRHLRAALPQSAVKLIRPLFPVHGTKVPTVLIPALAPARADIAGQLERLHDLTHGDVSSAILDTFAGEVPARWLPAMDDPGLYGAAFAQIFEAMWKAFEPLWRRSQPLREWETERMGIASVSGRMDVALSQFSQGKWRLEGQDLVYSMKEHDEHTLGDRRMILMPIVSGPDAGTFDLDQTDCLLIGCPTRGLPLLARPSEVPALPKDRLSVLLGQTRSTILRLCPHQPSMGDLATQLHCTAATITYHCRQLQDVGLVTRERRGQKVRLRLTTRGQAIIDLLA